MAEARPQQPASAAEQTSGRLALHFQEAFTIGIRLKANRQVATDADAFRNRVKQVLASADRTARADGYGTELVRDAVYVVIAFLDETVLGSSLPMSSAWLRQSLQEEVFGNNIAGEAFFEKLERLLVRPDSGEVADLLEVYQLCMLLGFHGKYATDARGELHRATSAVHQKIQRIRGPTSEFSPNWRLPQDVIHLSRDPWVRRLGVLALIAVASALLLFLIFSVLLRAQASQLTLIPGLSR